jgi:DeoR/GlpR family transcriptional regulator of sugar metabolism
MSKEREKKILEKLLKQKRITVKEAAKELYISEPSVRRDLASLEKQHLIKRIHGGAIIEETALSQNRLPFVLREMEESSGKVIIARKAAELVKDNDVIFLDASTSAYNLIPFLSVKKNITVVTNGVKALEKLAEYGINTISTGGSLIASCLALVGEEAYKTIRSVNADTAFFSCRGLSGDGFLTDISPEENYIRIRMIKNSERSYLLCAGDKIGKRYYHNLCHKDEITGIISDT